MTNDYKRLNSSNQRMENIDDLMRQKFNSDDPGERFEFQEEYWEQAKALLEQEEDRRRRWFWLFFTLALVVLLLTWFLLNGTGILSKNHEGVDKSSSSIEKAENQADNKGILPAAEQNGIVSNNKAENTENAATGDKTTETTRLQSEIFYPKKYHSGDSWEEKKRQQNTTKANTATALREDVESKRGQAAQNTSIVSNSKGGSIKDKSSASENVIAVSGLIPDQTGQNQTGQNTPQNTTGQGVETLSDNPIFRAKPIADSLSTFEIFPNIPIRFIPTPLNPLSYPAPVIAPKLRPAASNPIAKIPKPVKSNRFTLGMALTGAAYQADTTGRWAGWAMGATGQYKLNDYWSLRLGAEWRFVPGYSALGDSDSTNPAQVEQLRYSFGYKKEAWARETRGLHFLEIPAAAHWSSNRIGFEAGAVVGLLLAVENRTEHTISGSLQTPQTTVKKFVKGDASPYNKTSFKTFLGADYRLNNRFSLLTRVQYRITPMFKNTIKDVSNKGIGNIDLGLKIRLF